ncbi:MAG: hypothetical protein K2I17_06120 [Clostridia bacterium]|nr:hypothetical protein [Clostridia bacterium]
MKRRIKVLLATIISLAICCSFFVGSTFAYNESNYESAGLNFMEYQYKVSNIGYTELEIEDAINLYDLEESVVAKVLVLNRDGKIDYVILDFLVDDIIEFGFDCEEYINKFYGKGKIYYAGSLDCIYIDNGQYFDLHGNSLDSSQVQKAFNDIKMEFPKAASSSEFIISWNDVRIDSNASDEDVININDDFITGFNHLAFDDHIFYSQSLFNLAYNNRHPDKKVDGTCIQTAMTNMAIYFNWLGYENALINNDEIETFTWFINDTNYFKTTDSNWWKYTKKSFENYANYTGYDYYLKNYDSPTMDNYIHEIYNNRPIFSSFNAKTASGEEWSHAVIVVGYEKFSHFYQVNNRYWLFGWHDKWVEKRDDFYYLRCVDGWSTANQDRYINFNYQYRQIRASAFMLQK